MKIEIESRNINFNSKKPIQLILRGTIVGTYEQGLFDKFEQKYSEKNGTMIFSVENYACGLLHKIYDVPVLTHKDVEFVARLLRVDTGLSIEQWFTNYMKEYLEEA